MPKKTFLKLTGSSEEILEKFYQDIDRSPAACLDSRGDKLADFSPCTWGNSFSSADLWEFVTRLADEDAGCAAAIGAMVGMAIGDAAGAPLEFCKVDARLPDGRGGRYSDERRPCLLTELRAGELEYCNEFNKFKCSPGQWTDDTSMGLCMADSLLVHGKYHGADMRVRWHMWWNHGYCNAFRFDSERRGGRTSVGLGGNVKTSLHETEDCARRANLDKGEHDADAVPAIYSATANDAGNGSIMRLAPIPIAYHLSLQHAVDVGGLQSLASHPGSDATGCCRFMSFIICSAIAQHVEARRSAEEAGAVPAPHDDVRFFLDERIKEFCEAHIDTGVDDADAAQRLRALVLCQPPSENEAHWDWKQDELAINKALTARRGPTGDGTYNGHPVSSSYFGSYCLDGLAMALWALWHSTDYASCVQRAANLLGDADTVAAVAGQLAGSVYGWKNIVDNEWSRVCIASLKRWDPYADIPLRAALLYHKGPRPQVQLRQKENHPAVRAFKDPNPGSTVIGEIASGKWATCIGNEGEFVQVAWQKDGSSCVGWVGRKNVALEAAPLGTETILAHVRRSESSTRAGRSGYSS